MLEKLIYKEQTIVDELRKRTKNKERRTKNKEQSLYSWKNKEQKMSQLVTAISSVLFIEGNKHYRKIKH